MAEPCLAVIALGSNLGDREASLASGVRHLAEAPGVELTAISPFHDTTALKPYGYDDDAPRYLNAVALISTTLDPGELLELCMTIERAHGRLRLERWGDRTLDVDIITMGDVHLATEQLELPHPRAHERDFVLRPWLDVDPDAVLPGHGRVDELLSAMEDHA